MSKRLLGLLLVMGIMVGEQEAWAKPTDTDLRLLALEEKSGWLSMQTASVQ